MIDYCADSLNGLKKRSLLKGYSIRRVFFESVYKREVAAYLFVPDTVTLNPAIIYTNFENNDHESFIEEVESLVLAGYIALIIDSPFGMDGINGQKQDQKDLFRKTIEELVDIEKYFQTILDIRGGIDFLSTMPYIDKERIAYIGYSLGATWGGILAGIEDRIKTYILIAGFPKTSDWYLKSEHRMANFIRFILSPERYEYFISNIEKLNALQYIKNAAPASVFFQFAQHDEFITKEQSASYFSAASSPKKISWYNTGHPFTDCCEAAKDRLNWLNTTIRKENDKVIRNNTRNQNSFPF